MAATFFGFFSDARFVAIRKQLLGMELDSSERFQVSWSVQVENLEAVQIRRGAIRVNGRRPAPVVLATALRNSSALRTAGMIGDATVNGINSVMICSAWARQLDELRSATRRQKVVGDKLRDEGENGYALVNGGGVPLLGEVANAVLVWGDVWQDERIVAWCDPLFEDIVATFVFPGLTTVVADAELTDPPYMEAPAPERVARLPYCG